MKKSKRLQRTEQAPAVAESANRAWWPWAVAAGALFIVFNVYGPALNGAFVFDDRYMPFFAPEAPARAFSAWLTTTRPLLMASFWVNYQWSGLDPGSYRIVNVLLHFFGSFLFTLVVARILTFAGVSGTNRTVLSLFGGGLFLLHPLNTESVAYITSRSETLSVLFYWAAFTVFLYLPVRVSWFRIAAILLLFGAALTTKEHTVTLPILFVLTDLMWIPGGLRRHRSLYATVAVLGMIGTVLILKVVSSADSVGFHLKDLSPITYFFTQCRVIWIYVRMFFLPFGQNVDADIPVSHSLLEHGAIFGLVGLIALAAAAWVYRKKWPLASYGVFVFLLLLAPTSSFAPIQDVMVERRLYLPFLGLVLVCLELLRNVPVKQAARISAVVLIGCSILSYRRNQVWAGPLPLWQDSASKSPQKVRPQFQVAYAFFDQGQCQPAADHYAIAAALAPPAADLLLDWGLALDCAKHPDDALAKLQQAASLERSAQTEYQIAKIWAEQRNWQEALGALALAEQIDPKFEMTYVLRGQISEIGGDQATARQDYRHALDINPANTAARDALIRVSR